MNLLVYKYAWLIWSILFPAFQTGLPLLGVGSQSSSGSHTFTFITSSNASTACNVAGTACSLTIPSTGSGHVLTVGAIAYDSTQVTISSVTGAGTSSLCTSSACAGQVACCGADLNGDWAFVPSTTGSQTSITVNVNTAPGSGNWFVWSAEYSFTGAGAVVFDTGSTATSAGCTSCVGPTLTLGGSSDLIMALIYPQFSATAVSGSYSSPFDGPVFGGNHPAFAGWINAATGTAATWTVGVSGPALMSNMALK